MGNLEHENQLGQEAVEQTVAAESEPESAEKRQPTPESLGQRIAEIDSAIASGERSISETQTQLTEARASLGLPDSQEVPHSIQVTAERNASLGKERASAEVQLSAQVATEQSKDAASTESEEDAKFAKLRSEMEATKKEMGELDRQEKEINKVFKEKVAEMEAARGSKLSTDERVNLGEQMFGAVRVQIKTKESKVNLLARNLRDLRAANAKSQPRAAEKRPAVAEPESTREAGETGNENEATARKIQEILKSAEIGKPMDQLAKIFAERNEDRLTPLASPDDVLRFRGAIRDLENLLEQENLILPDVENAYGNISSVFSRMNEAAPRASAAREDSESLGRLASSFRSIIEMNNDLASRLGSVDDSPNRADTARLTSLLRRVNDSVDAKLAQVNRLADIVRRYGR